MTITVETQAELDAALASDESYIIIDSPRGVWLQVNNYDSATVRAYGSATVEAYDSATVRASGSATVEASGSATVEAYGSATVRAYDSATVRASGTATVEAYGSATVRAYDSATVRASKFVAVHLHSKLVKVDGGVVIDVTDLDLNDSETWVEYHGITVEGGQATVYKAVDAALFAGQNHTPTEYPIGGTVTAPDWKPTSACGNGLHFGYTPLVAASYFNGEGKPKFLECRIPVAGMIALGDKVKAEWCLVVREVDANGDPL